VGFVLKIEISDEQEQSDNQEVEEEREDEKDRERKKRDRKAIQSVPPNCLTFVWPRINVRIIRTARSASEH